MNADKRTTIAENLVSYRREKGMSQEELAERLGISRQAVSKWERGESQPDMGNLIALADVYGVTIDDIVRPSANPQGASDADGDAVEEVFPDEDAAKRDVCRDESLPNDAVSVEEGTALENLRDEDAFTREPPVHMPPPTGEPISFDGDPSAESGAITPARKSRVKLVVIIVICLVVCLGLAALIVSCVSGVGAAFSSLSVPSAPEAPSAPAPPQAPKALASSDGWVQGETADVPADSIDNLAISWLAGSAIVTVVPDSETDGAIRITEWLWGSVPRDQLMEYKIEDRTLSIDYARPHFSLFWGCSNIGKKHLEVLVPKSAANSLGVVDIDVASGSFDLKGISCDRMLVDVASGEVHAGDIEASAAELHLASGHIEITGAVSDALYGDIASGTAIVTCTDKAPASMEVNLASGNATLAIPEESGFDAQVDKASGMFDCEFKTTSQDGRYICGNGACKMEFSIMSGSVVLRPA